MNTKLRLKECFNKIGVIVEETDDFLLSDVIDDSLLFVSMIIEIEQAFDIEIPDDYLTGDTLSSFHSLENLVESLVNPNC